MRIQQYDRIAVMALLVRKKTLAPSGRFTCSSYKARTISWLSEGTLLILSPAATELLTLGWKRFCHAFSETLAPFVPVVWGLVKNATCPLVLTLSVRLPEKALKVSWIIVPPMSRRARLYST